MAEGLAAHATAAGRRVKSARVGSRGGHYPPNGVYPHSLYSGDVRFSA